MFNAHQFYPTPSGVAAVMVAELKRNRKDIFPLLEPSAGKGDLLSGFYSQEYRRISCVEIDPELQATLKGQGFKVVGSDFLSFNESGVYQSILMNPPFSNGIDHFLHAWELLAPGGRIVCLLPDTVFNLSNQKQQKLSELCKIHDCKAKSLGQCFQNAERKTNVNIVMLSLDKPKEKSRFDFSGFSYSVEDFESALSTNEVTAGIEKRDVVKSLVHQYEMALQALRERHQSHENLKFALQGISSYSALNRHSKSDLLKEDSFEIQAAELKARFWETVFQKTELEHRATSDFQKKFSEWEKEQINFAFNEENIKSMLLMFWQNKEQIDIDSLCHVFDFLTRNHANCVVGEGWKTNKASKLNTKVIIECGVNYEPNWGFSTNYHRGDNYNDIDKALCILSGKNFLKIKTLNDSIYSFIRGIEGVNDYTQKFDSEFFEIRIFKKGSVHLWFKDVKLNEEFNKRVAMHRKWIGSDY